ncbi:MAG: hypothetical protein WCE82_09155 [Halobacteriota archaeon]
MTGCLPLPFITNYGLLGLFLVSATSSVLRIPTEPTIALLLRENASPLTILFVLIPASVLGASVGYFWGNTGYGGLSPSITPNAKRWCLRSDKYGAARLIISPRIPFAGDLVPVLLESNSIRLED